MSAADVQAVVVTAVLCALGGYLVPHLVARVPEPEPKSEEQQSEAERAEGPKETYAAIAALGWFAPAALLLSGVSGGLIAATLGWSWLLVGFVPLVPLCVALAVIDLRTRLLPSRLVLPATAAAIVLGAAYAGLVGEWVDLWRALVGMAVGRSFYWVLWFVRSAGMGFGDVRLSALLGFVLALVGLSEWAFGMVAGFFLFAIPGALFALVRRDASLLKVAYPFGPFMIVAALLGICVGDPVLDHLVTR